MQPLIQEAVAAASTDHESQGIGAQRGPASPPACSIAHAAAALALRSRRSR
jgi:hypothetical protein